MTKIKDAVVEAVIKEILGDKPEVSSAVPFEIGEKYFIRTVTYFATGKIKRICGNFLELEDAA